MNKENKNEFSFLKNAKELQEKEGFKKVKTPYDFKVKATQTKPVRVNIELHQLLKMYSSLGNGSMLDLVNQALQEYVSNHDIKGKLNKELRTELNKEEENTNK